VRHRVDVWRAAYADAGTPLTLDAPGSLTVRVLPDVVDAVLDALLDNARTYAPGHPVDLQLRSVGEGVETVVRDRGSGLDAEERERAGERFWRGSRHAGLPGTGLGLAISRALAEAAGGELLLEQTEPHGLTVRLRLPQS
jgi:signal transduction histidine kinase